MRTFVSLIVIAIAGCLAAAATTSAVPVPVVTVPALGPLQIAVVLPESGGAAADGANVEQAIQMAVADHGPVRGFTVELNDFDGPCGGDVSAAHAAAAAAVVANTQNVGVIGHYCSGGDKAALPTYEDNGVVAISGSVTGDAVPGFGPTVFDRTVLPDAANGNSAGAWYKSIQNLKSERRWQDAYTAKFGQAPVQYADLYYDATMLLLDRIGQVATLNGNGSLSIDRAALAAAVRNTTDYIGVSCTITLDPATGNRIDDHTPHSVCK